MCVDEGCTVSLRTSMWVSVRLQSRNIDHETANAHIALIFPSLRAMGPSVFRCFAGLLYFKYIPPSSMNTAQLAPEMVAALPPNYDESQNRRHHRRVKKL